MIKKFNTIIYSMIAISIIAILVGIVMMWNPFGSVYVIALLVGCYFIVDGITRIIIGIKASKYHLPYDGTAYGVLSLVLGIIAVVCFVKHPVETEVIWIYFIGLSLGISIIIASIYDIKAAILLKKVPRSNWGIILCLGILTLILGVVFMCMPFAGGLTQVYVAGIFLTAFGVVNLIDTICLKSQAEQYEKAVKRKADDVSDFINKSVDTAAGLYKEGKDIVEDQIDKFKN